MKAPAVWEPHDDPASRLRGGRLALAVIALTGAYVLLGRLGLSLAPDHINATLIWPPTGVSLAALVLYGRRLWPGVFAGALAANLAIGTALGIAIGIALGNTLEAVIGSLLLERVGRFHPGFARMRDVLVFGAFGALTCTLVSATIGVLSLELGGALGGHDASEVWLTWWLGDAGSAALVTPVFLVAARGAPRWSELASRRESWIVLCLAIATGATAFGARGWPSFIPLFLSFLAFAFLIWAGMRLGPRGAVVVAALLGAIAVLGTAFGHGPFASESQRSSMLVLWAYVTVFGAAAAILAAAIAERDHAEAARVLAEAERRAIQTQMERAQRLESLGVIAGGIAHDFNNILTAIRGNAELLRLDLPETGAAASTLSEIDHASERAAELCRQLLDYAGESVRRPAPVDLAALVTDVRRLVTAAIRRSTELRLELDVGAPVVIGDAPQLRQIVMNLVLNAAEAIANAAPDGGGTIVVRSRVETYGARELNALLLASDALPGSFAVLEVEDDGAGMSAETLERVFEPFFTTKEHGRGLGMAAVAGIVRAHRGAVSAASELGRGTCFRVLLPIEPRDRSVREL